jgi:hypothetical protein
MPAGLPYFAWIDQSETTFTSAHLRWDEQVFSFTLKQDEGDPASLTLVVRRPRNSSGDPIGLLGPGRKIWCWFALDCGPDLIRFRGRLVGVPTSIFEELVTLEFVARPFDVVAQKNALAATLRVLPYYDEVVIDEARRSDPEVVLEGYTKIWAYDRETLIVSVSDEITGEDGLVTFDDAAPAVLWDGLSLSLTSGPLSRVDVAAEYSWTQGARGNVDLTQYLISHWDSSGYAQQGSIASYTFGADSWPKNGTGIGDGWEVAEASAIANYDLTVQTKATGGGAKTIFGDGTTSTVSWSDSQDYLLITPPGTIFYSEIITSQSSDATFGGVSSSGSSVSTNWSSVKHLVPMLHTQPMLMAAYTAGRGCTERVSFSLFADVQPILTDPDDGEALQITDVKSVNLSEPINGVVPIGDVRRRSYIATARGNQSLEHLIALARANLMKRSRVVEISFVPRLERMPEITLRKNLFLIEPRVGEALGKIIGYSVALDGSDGQIKCEIRIGCTIGRGGSQALTAGTPTYATIDYVGADYQQFNNRLVALASTDTSVGYAPPNADPNDDGIEFLSVLRAEDVIDTPLAVENPPQAQFDHIITQTASWLNFYDTRYRSEADVQESVKARVDHINDAMKEVETKATFKLKSMTRDFVSDYNIQVTDLKIPTGYNLEAT